MPVPTPRMIFVNLAVQELSRARDFFAALGFGFNAQFTDDKAACMVLSDQGYVMLLAEPFFRSFTDRAPCDTRTHVEALVGLSCASRDEVDALHTAAIRAGGADAGHAQDHGFMYSRAFHDLDGHHWELIWMDPAAVQPA